MPGTQDIVYIIDPDEAVHDALSALFGSSGVEVRCFQTAEAFLESDVLLTGKHACLLVEADLPGMGSLAFVRQLHAQYTDLPIVVLASTSDRDIADQALKAGAVDVFDKPLIGDRLLDRIQPKQIFNNNP